MKNIEIKLRLFNFQKVKSLLKKIGGKEEGVLKQTDTYFNCQNGRLKLREINNRNFELISYQRAEIKGPKISDIKILELDKHQVMVIKNILIKALGIKIIVKKERNLWIYKHTRIHFDRVSKLGKFLELETVMRDIDYERAKKEHQKIINLLNICQYKRISKSYSDLVESLK